MLAVVNVQKVAKGHRDMAVAAEEKMVYVPVHGSYILECNIPNRAEIIQYITTDEVNIPCDKCFHFFPLYVAPEQRV